MDEEIRNEFYIKVNGKTYPTTPLQGRFNDPEWDNRHTLELKVKMSYEEAVDIFVDGITWSTIFVVPSEDPEAEPYTEEYDQSEFTLAGDITDHRDGTVSVKMGKLTDLEEAYLLLYGGEE